MENATDSPIDSPTDSMTGPIRHPARDGRSSHSNGIGVRTVFRFVFCLFLICLIATPASSDEGGPPPLPIGAAAPDFCLPGIDGQSHCLKDYAASKVLVI